jgi:hypothetical protein
MKTFAGNLIHFYKNIRPPENLPRGIEILFPQQEQLVMKIVRSFFKKFYDDNHPRHLLIGINPGRFGAGITGINFTAPLQLTKYCGIDNPFKQASELSAEFIYEVIERYGGVHQFYKSFFITAMSPLGFIKDGINLNYYDDKKLQSLVTPFIAEKIEEQLSFGFKTDYCICIGGAKNYSFLQRLNDEHKWFEKIIPLPHPRFILQYRRKQKEQFIREYLVALNQPAG